MRSKAILVCCILFPAFAARGEELRAGAAASNITPLLDQPLAGYFYPRPAEGVHDDLLAKALVLDDGRSRVVLVACDTVSVDRGSVADARVRIEKQLGIPASHVLISATHSHTGPELTPAYLKTLGQRIADGVVTASGRMQPVRLFAAVEREASLPHYRRYRMTDGTVVTNPGFQNPKIVKPVGEIDAAVPVLYAITGNGAPLFTWVNYGMHLDTVGGTWISADYPYHMARALASVKGPDMLTVFTIGSAGNINHWDVSRPGPQRGNAEAQRLGEVLSSAVVRAYTHLTPVAPPRVHALSAQIRLPLRKVTPEQVEAARKLLAVEPPRDVDFTLDRVEATRIAGIADRKAEELTAEIQVMSIGSIAIVGIPGELFVELGREIQSKSPFANTVIVTLANDDIGYIPHRAAYEEGAYEPTSSPLVPGSGEQIVARALEMLKELKRQMDK